VLASHAAAASEDSAAEVVVSNQRLGVSQHREAAARLSVRPNSASNAALFLLCYCCRYLASLAFTMAVKFGDQQTITKLTEQFDRYFDPATSRMKPGLDPNLREPVFFAAGTTPQRYPHLVKMLAATTDAAETIRIIRAICEFPTSRENMRTSLEMSLDSFKIRRQDASYALSYVAQNINGGLDTAWQVASLAQYSQLYSQSVFLFLSCPPNLSL
jgi:hypothetical protein